jgi:hypothetical protein
VQLDDHVIDIDQHELAVGDPLVPPTGRVGPATAVRNRDATASS